MEIEDFVVVEPGTSLCRTLMFYTAEISSVFMRNSAFHALRLRVRGVYLFKGCDGLRGKFTGPSNSGDMLHSHIGRAVRICLACIASDQGRWIPPKLRT